MLYDPAISSDQSKQRVSVVISHEIVSFSKNKLISITTQE